MYYFVENSREHKERNYPNVCLSVEELNELLTNRILIHHRKGKYGLHHYIFNMFNFTYTNTSRRLTFTKY